MIEEMRESTREGVAMWTLFCLDCLRENGPFDFKCCSECGGGSFDLVPASTTGVIVLVDEYE